MTQCPAPDMTWEAAVRWLLDHDDKAKRDLARACYFDETPEKAALRFWASPEWAGTRDLLPAPPGRALDLGAGRGISSLALAKDGWQVDAVEPDASDLVGIGAIVEIIRQTSLPITITACYAESLPFEDESFDLVLCRQALHHAKDLDTMCCEALRVLRKGGVFLATREHVLTRESDLQTFLDAHPLHQFYGGEHAYTLERYLAALSLPKPEKIETFSPYQSIINVFPSSFEAERARMARIAGVAVEQVPDFAFRIRDAYDSTPGRLFSFKVTK